MRAIILAGGRGRRLRPLTDHCPKPLLPVANRPLVEYQVDLLRRHGFADVVLSLGYRSRGLRRHLGDGSRLGVRIRYAVETEPLGTGGAIAHAATTAPGQRLLVLNGDVLLGASLDAFLAAHVGAGAAATIGLVRSADPTSYGLVHMDAEGRVRQFVEKPPTRPDGPAWINAGVYVLEPDLIAGIPRGRPVSLEREVFPSLLERGWDIRGHAIDGYWLDVGTPERYVQANFDIMAGCVRGSAGDGRTDGICQGRGVRVDRGARLHAPVCLGNGVRIAEGAEVGPFAILGTGSTVGHHAMLAFVVAMPGCVIGARSRLSRALLDRRVRVGEDVAIEDVVLAAGSAIGRGTRMPRLDQGPATATATPAGCADRFGDGAMAARCTPVRQWT